MKNIIQKFHVQERANPTAKDLGLFGLFFGGFLCCWFGIQEKILQKRDELAQQKVTIAAQLEELRVSRYHKRDRVHAETSPFYAFFLYTLHQKHPKALTIDADTVGFHGHLLLHMYIAFQANDLTFFIPKQCVTLRGSYGKGKAS